jgi:hypothetical protein
MWTLVLICVSLNNPNDIPGKILIPFESREQCETAINNSSFWIKFDSFTVRGECHESQKINKKDLSSLHKPR